MESDEKTHMGMGNALVHHGIITGPTNTFVLTIHHSIYDGMSLEMMFNDLVQAIEGVTPPARTQFRDFIQHTMQKNADKATEEYWRKELSEEI